MLKTRKAAAKRFRMNKKGKVKRGHPGRGHLLTGKSRATKRKLRKAAYLVPAEAAKVRRYLPYG